MAELSSILSEVFAGGRRFLGLSGIQQAPADVDSVAELCRLLLSSRGEASGIALGGEVLAGWEQLSDQERERFFDVLLTEFGPNAPDMNDAIKAYATDPSPASMLAINRASEPRRQELIRRLNLAPGGTATLVKMRRFLLERLRTRPDLKPVDADFLHLFNSWFNRGFLVLRPIDWSTPANILEKIIRYEAVHEIASWDDLKRRLAPADRRCFAFFHPQLIDEPLVFVEVALTDDMPDAIEGVLDEHRPSLDPSKAQYATFYSISNCQDGLRGISFGNFLIKQVVEDLRRELPNLSHFVTLSPVPGFSRWLGAEMDIQQSEFISEEEREGLQVLRNADWYQDDAVVEQVTPVLMVVAARYFMNGKKKDGRAADPVARFHLRNGARLERINMLADNSAKALKQSHGLMVNYLYRLDEVEANHEAFVERGEVVASSSIRQAASARRRLLAPRN